MSTLINRTASISAFTYRDHSPSGSTTTPEASPSSSDTQTPSPFISSHQDDFTSDSTTTADGSCSPSHTRAHSPSASSYPDHSPSGSPITTGASSSSSSSSSSGRSTSTDASYTYTHSVPRTRHVDLENAIDGFFQDPGAMLELKFLDAQVKLEDYRASTAVTQRQVDEMEAITRQGKKRDRKDAARKKRAEAKEAERARRRLERASNKAQSATPLAEDLSSDIEPVEYIKTSASNYVRAKTDTSLMIDQSTVTVREVSDPLTQAEPPRHEIREVLGKGLGLIATVHIGQGEVIIAESPFLVVDHPPLRQQIRRRMAELSPADKDLVHTFKPSLGSRWSSRLVDIIATNVIPLGGEPLEDEDDDIIPLDKNGELEQHHLSGLFKSICRVNHACLPNSQWTWFAASNQLVLRALVPIPAGVEITACYLQDPALGHEERQHYLKDIWGFTCQCDTCELAPVARSDRDKRLKRYRDIRDEYIGEDNEDTWQREGLVVCSREIKEALKILESCGPIEEVAECHSSLFKLSVRWGDEMKAIREGKASLRHLLKMGDEVGAGPRQQMARPRLAVGWGLFDDDRSGDESECDSEDDFEKTVLVKDVKLGRSYTLPSRSCKRSRLEGPSSV